MGTHHWNFHFLDFDVMKTGVFEPSCDPAKRVSSAFYLPQREMSAQHPGKISPERSKWELTKAYLLGRYPSIDASFLASFDESFPIIVQRMILRHQSTKRLVVIGCGIIIIRINLRDC
jgi:hypothetical protein